MLCATMSPPERTSGASFMKSTSQTTGVRKQMRRVRIEAGVMWQQLTEELARKGMRMIMPLLPHGNRSVLTVYLEREVPTNTVYDYGEPMQSMEVVWPTGEIFRLGSASVNGYPDSASKGANPGSPSFRAQRSRCL